MPDQLITEAENATEDGGILPPYRSSKLVISLRDHMPDSYEKNLKENHIGLDLSLLFWLDCLKSDDLGGLKNS